MPANTSPIFTLVPNVGRVTIATASANVKSDGAGTLATDIFKAFTAGANGSFVERVRFVVVASAAAVTSVPTTLRVFLSTVAAGGTTAADTFLIGEVSVPALVSTHSTNANSPYELYLSFAIPSGTYIHVSQHVAQTANQSWVALVIGGDY